MSRSEYDKALKYLYGLEKFGMVFGLDNIRWLLSTIGSPHAFIRTVHVAGTNGKGSTATMLSCILKEGGFRVGKYTSPHLISFTERITVDEVEITESETVELTQDLRSEANEKDPKRFFTFFDFTTALAFEFFKRKKVDIAVIETGLGGRYDSTNVIEPLVSVITNVGYDHMEHLGTTIEEIAAEKAGIIKKGVPVITGCKGAAREIIEGRAKELECRTYVLDRDFSYIKEGDRRLAYRGIHGDVRQIFVNLAGDHQLTNCAVALCAAEVLSFSGYATGNEAASRALSRVTLQGRLERVNDRPLVLLDAAHNPHGMHALTEYVKTHFPEKKKILVFGVMKDKEYEKMLDEIVPAMDVVILTKPDIERALSPHDVNLPSAEVIITDDTKSALQRAKETASGDDLVLVTGSFYTIGEAKAVIHEVF